MSETFIPIPAKSGKFLRRRFHQEVRLNHLPEKPLQELPGGDFREEIEFHFIHTTSGDIDNLLKPTLDVIKGSMLRDDRQIKIVHAKLCEYSAKSGVLIKLTPLHAGPYAEQQEVQVEATIVQNPPRKKKAKKKTKKRGLLSRLKKLWR